MTRKAGSASGGRAGRGWPAQRVFLGHKGVLDKSQGRTVKVLDICVKRRQHSECPREP